ncbi:DUF3558 domain-containing protein [Amycolatopsis sp. K13G38]|uniref:DUF3558 domain-containing protein n=1 Tax=Amycolatopsis acididurans TaxID=2724524 RepID=A0ABX1J176_9PSEU|nr:DUF3558 family protein [Amycolatopsis acididurans]NKQ53513.1 DUF3558 domain-containing protein [Amycolatopsis acididurans]
MSVIAMTAVAITSCGDETPGSPQPASNESSASSPGTTGAASNALAAVKACTLLTNAEAQQAVPGIGAPVDKGQLGGSSSACDWAKPATDTEGAVGFIIAVRPTQTLDEVVFDRGVSSTGTFGSLKARQVKGIGGEGTCLLSLAAGNVGRVDINTSSGRLTSDEACQVTSKVAEVIEPKLPA